jgi:hypothetical protein
MPVAETPSLTNPAEVVEQEIGVHRRARFKVHWAWSKIPHHAREALQTL